MNRSKVKVSETSYASYSILINKFLYFPDMDSINHQYFDENIVGIISREGVFYIKDKKEIKKIHKSFSIFSQNRFNNLSTVKSIRYRSMPQKNKFMPEINRKSKQIDRKRNAVSRPRHDLLIRAGVVYNQNKSQKVLEKARKTPDNCTFRPDLQASSARKQPKEVKPPTSLTEFVWTDIDANSSSRTTVNNTHQIANINVKSKPKQIKKIHNQKLHYKSNNTPKSTKQKNVERFKVEYKKSPKMMKNKVRLNMVKKNKSNKADSDEVLFKTNSTDERDLAPTHKSRMSQEVKLKSKGNFYPPKAYLVKPRVKETNSNNKSKINTSINNTTEKKTPVKNSDGNPLKSDQNSIQIEPKEYVNYEIISYF